MRYWQEGHRIARLSDPEAISGELFNWTSGTWQPAKTIGIDIRFSGDWTAISEAEASRLTSAAVAG
ncbi:hypothetical protein [Nocardioides sp. LHG3406-4]|uniref:hypothetical protein n=1 Tax=Nocardioides sp. LHG3406-4 TaxID=2804575 RepID=UPI003CF5CF5A